MDAPLFNNLTIANVYLSSCIHIDITKLKNDVFVCVYIYVVV